MLLSAYALDYGTSWIGAFDEKAVARIMKAPPESRTVAIVPVGRPTEKPDPAPTPPISKIVYHNIF